MVKNTYFWEKEQLLKQFIFQTADLVSKWERISRKQLPINIRVNRVRTIGPRRNYHRICFNLARDAFRKIKKKPKEAATQSGKGLGSDFAKMGLNMESKVLGSEIGKKLINKGIDTIPNIFKFGASKIKNKTAKRALNSEIADLVVNEAQKKVRKKFDRLVWIKWGEYQTIKLKKHLKNFIKY